MSLAIKWAREQQVPFLGICLGFQVAVIEWARNVLGVTSKHYFSCFVRCTTAKRFTCNPQSLDANSGEFVGENDDSAIVFMPEGSRTHMGGTMRLGLRPTVFSDASENAKIRQLYGGAPKIWERHRHRYEVSPRFVKRLEESGFHFVGKDECGERMQIVELPSTSKNIKDFPPTADY